GLEDAASRLGSATAGSGRKQPLLPWLSRPPLGLSAQAVSDRIIPLTLDPMMRHALDTLARKPLDEATRPTG
ncbi:hypothetical protein WG922_00005, partial [Ramlibacter sp. AN1015]|uniref:hypothetical protein n=1 Tax=Ramlibacter sp. AN1015 TaxID=3133428 RepID=UPI0030C0C911